MSSRLDDFDEDLLPAPASLGAAEGAFAEARRMPETPPSSSSDGGSDDSDHEGLLPPPPLLPAEEPAESARDTSPLALRFTSAEATPSHDEATRTTYGAVAPDVILLQPSLALRSRAPANVARRRRRSSVMDLVKAFRPIPRTK